MNIFDFAMKMEKDGERYYREIANKVQDKKIRNILNMLADAEVNHFNVMKSLKSARKYACSVHSRWARPVLSRGM